LGLKVGGRYNRVPSALIKQPGHLIWLATNLAPSPTQIWPSLFASSTEAEPIEKLGLFVPLPLTAEAKPKD
jgi:hypothetical protein